ncbi:hypothetical protein GH714_029636 [Hevea brasiliensis]|uniref:Uncharacterized protein n=1 Tax=Hevea brasiliensis TaxID=3981 RepID=A0A6A6KZK9_HEVBR|nr:hypothetical protein GH714_029636 [Hevea brasiliensis]
MGPGNMSRDRIVRIGTEAAKTLADLAHLAMRESRRRDSGGEWGSKGKQVRNGEPDSSQQQQGNPAIANEPRTPLCIVSCPWVFLVPDHGNGIHPLPSLGYSQDGTSVSNQYNYSLSSKAAALTENQLSSSPEKVELEAAGSTEVRVINDHNETPI